MRPSILFMASAFPFRLPSRSKSILASLSCSPLRQDTVAAGHSSATTTILRSLGYSSSASAIRDVMSSAILADSSVAHIPIENSRAAFASTTSGYDLAPLSSGTTGLQPLLVCLTTRYAAKTSDVITTPAIAPKGNSGTEFEPVLDVVVEEETVGPARTTTAPFMKVCMVQW